MFTDFTPISDIGEFGLIDRMNALLGQPNDADIIAGIADDAAVYRIGNGRVHVVTTDALFEGVHFDRLLMPMEYLGYKTISVNVSDVVAMNARPRYATITLGIPDTLSVEMIVSFYEGIKKACEVYEMTVVGGDTAAARFLTISVTVIGEAGEDEIIYRNGARSGDVLCVTGDLGAAYAGLKILLDQRREMQDEGDAFVPNIEPYQYVIQRQLSPAAQTKIRNVWAAKGVRPHALIDISDGLASEVHHLCKQSQCGAILYAAAIPIALETRDVADFFSEDVDTYALFGGEDYELLFALAPEDLDSLDSTAFSVIGEFTQPETGINLQTPEGGIIPLGTGGYQHF